MLSAIQDIISFILRNVLQGAQSRSTDRKRLYGAREKLHALNCCLSGEPKNEVPICYVLSKERMKRESPFQTHQMGPQKRRVIEKDVHDLQVHLNDPLSFVNVDAAMKSLGYSNLRSYSRNGRTGLVKVDVGKIDDSFHYRTSATADADSCTSSVGSCSANDGDMACGFINHQNTGNADESSDAESFCGKEHKNGKENTLERSHSSELHAYSRTIQALFASGPFSWEEETYISNLRRSLHISDDEHLRLVRTLVSSGTRKLIC